MWHPEEYTFASWLFLRLLGLIYLFAFGAFLFQYKGLFGKNGILPLESYMAYLKRRLRSSRRYCDLPTVFWWKASENAILAVLVAGCLLSCLLMADIQAPAVLILLFILYISIVLSGQDFLSFGWELFLLEITSNAFLLSLTPVPNPFVWISLNFLLFRFNFEAGTSKLESHDVNWRNLTAIKFHYQSQPLPNTQAWYFYRLPMWMQKFSCALMFFGELVVPFAIFGDDYSRVFAFIGLIGLQFAIWFTGNFSFLNHMTCVLCVILLPNWLFEHAGMSIPAASLTWEVRDIMVSLLGASLFFFQVCAFWNHYAPNATLRRILRVVYSFHIANRYGIFAVMTTKRFEIVIEGSDDGKEWKEYLFRYKPSELNRRPRRVSPYQPRLDWQAWFLPFTSYKEEEWLQSFVVRLLQGVPEVCALLRHNPFANKPPRYVRVLMYDYEFTTVEEKKKTGNWWKRRFVGAYSPILCLKDSDD